MKLTICLAKTVIIFYAFLAPIIIIASSYNLIKGIIMGQTPTVGLGPFSLFGFIILPLAIVITYRKNKCVIQSDKISIGKANYLSSDYSFYITEEYLPLKDRPITSMLKNRYFFVIKKRENSTIVFQEEINVWKRDIEKMKLALFTNFGGTK